jgi:hypothetical protein
MDWKALIPSFEDAFRAETSQADYRRITSGLQTSSLKVAPARSMMLRFWSYTWELQTGNLMTDPSATVEQPHEILPPIDRGMSIGKAAGITVASAILVTGSTYWVVKGTLSAGMTRLLAVISLLSLVGLAYGMIELALAVIATTAERRRMAREVTERRQGDRARTPTPR